MLTGMSGKRVRVLGWMVGKRGWVFTHLSFTLGVLTGSSQRRRDVDIDFFLMFSVVDENLSWYLDENIALFCTDPGSVDKEDEEFQESNKMHGRCQLHEAPVLCPDTPGVSVLWYLEMCFLWLRVRVRVWREQGDSKL